MSKPRRRSSLAADRRWWGLKSGIVALHDVNQEADCCAAVVGFLPDEGGQFLVEGGRFYRRERKGRGVFPGWGGVGVGVDEGLGPVEAKVQELTGGVELVAGLGVFEVALHDVYEEADY